MIRLIFRGDDEKATERFAVLSVEMLRAALESGVAFQAARQPESGVRGQESGDESQISNLKYPISSSQPSTRLLGPAPCPMAKLRGKYRYHALIFTTNADDVRKIVGEITATFDAPENIQWVVDVDPMDLM
jgi:hypothetical protein